MTEFTPITALIGGALIGLSAVLLIWLNGCIAGASSIIKGALTPSGQHTWQVLFCVGLLLGVIPYYLFSPLHFTPRVGFPFYLLILSGILVGIGTGISHGCTSGHGICGNARFSKRSAIATFLFIGTAMVTVYIVRHVLGIG